MYRSSTLTRFSLVMLIMLMASMLVGPAPGRAQDGGTATLRIISLSCPEGLGEPDFQDICEGEPIPDTYFSLIGPLTDVERVVDGQLNSGDGGQTAADGMLTFTGLAPGGYEVVGGLRVDFGGVQSWCYQTGDRTASIGARTTSTDQSDLSAPGPGYFSTFVTLTAGGDVTCEAFARNGVPDVSADPTPSTESLTPETDGSRVTIFAGDCDTFDSAAEPVATLTNARPAEGERRGSESASATESSVTTLDLSLDDLLSDDHVLVVFDQVDDTVPLACGAIGGVVTEDGTLTFGLPAVGESRFAGIATLAVDGDAVVATVLLAEGLHGD